VTIILALDPGQCTGIARSDGTTATLDLRDAFKTDAGHALHKFACAMKAEISKAHLVLIERPFGTTAATLLPEVLTARIHEIAFLAFVPRRELAVQTIRKIVCGSGRAKKADVLPAVNRAGWICANKHEADAVAVLLAGIELAKREPLAPPAAHDVNCEFWHDQYPQECNCGVTRPRASGFIPFQETPA
jgi:Holliday junction resolvasome RuvABC endonuclease subunit